MDSVSQAVWGALLCEATQKQKKGRVPGWLIGLLAGTLPDFDTFIKSTEDPLLATVFHRHFTHSILFIPFGGLITWVIFWPFFRKERENYKNYFLLATVGYGSHWTLDIMTAYGTQLFWPVTNHRYYLDWLSIVDPLLTIPWIIAWLVFIFSKKRKWIHLCLAYSLFYFGFGAIQHSRAVSALHRVAESRGHTVERYRALPSLGNSVWFRTIYIHDSKIYADGILVQPWSTQVFLREGTSVQHLTKEMIETSNREGVRLVEIWDWFTDGYMYYQTPAESEIGDGRYSINVSGFEPLWTFQFNKDQPMKSKKTQPRIRLEGDDKRSPLEGFILLTNPSQVGREL